MFQEDEWPVRIKKRNFKKKQKVKMRDRYGKSRKNKEIESDSIERLNEEFYEYIEE